MLEGLAAGGLVVGSWAGKKLLGPLFDEIAEGWREQYSERRKRNLVKILQKAEQKAGDALKEVGEVPPRVSLAIIEQGSWCDSEVMSEYFAGILAASRSADGVDDRGVSWANLVARLSSFDVHLHYLAYEAFRRLYLGQTDLNLGSNQVRIACEVYLPAANLLTTMGRAPNLESWLQYGAASFNALAREDLVGETHAYGHPDHLAGTHSIDAPDHGIVFIPSVPGIELFLWAHGHGNVPVNGLLVPPDREFPSQGLTGVTGARSVSEMQQERRDRIAREQAEQQASPAEELEGPAG